MDRNDSEIVQSNGIGLFTKEGGDSPEEGEAPEDTIDNVNTNALKHTRVINNLCTKGCRLSGSRSLNRHSATYHFRCCPEMKVVQLLM